VPSRAPLLTLIEAFLRIRLRIRFTGKQTRVGVYFSSILYLRVPVHKVMFSFPIYILDFVDCSFLSRIEMKQFCFISWQWLTSTRFLCWQNDIFACRWFKPTINFYPLLLHVPPQRVFFLFSKMEALARSPLHLSVVSLCGSCSSRTFLSKYVAKHVLSSVFLICIKHKSA
jgi:hypothetical protein